MAKVVGDSAARILPLSANVAVNPETIVGELRRAKSGEFAAWLLKQPEPTEAEVSELLKITRDALSNLRQHFADAAKAGPRPKHGPPPRNLTDPATREKIRAKITSLRSPSTTLDDIYGRLENEYPGIKSATFKRIWQEGLKKKSKELSKKDHSAE